MGEFKTLVKELETDMSARTPLTPNEESLIWTLTQMAWALDDLTERVQELQKDTKPLRDPYR